MSVHGTHYHCLYDHLDNETEVEVAYTYRPAVEARTCCDPDDGWPSEPAEVVLTDYPSWLTAEQYDAIVAQIEECGGV